MVLAPPRPLAENIELKPSTFIAAAFLACPNGFSAPPPPPILADSSVVSSRMSWGEVVTNEFSGWLISDIVYVQPASEQEREEEHSTMVGYRRPALRGFYLRLDFADLRPEAAARGLPLVSVEPVAPPAPRWWQRLWRFLSPPAPPPTPVMFRPGVENSQIKSHWSSEVDAVEAFIPMPKWSDLDMRVKIQWGAGREEVLVLPTSPLQLSPALIAVVAHGNQPVSPDSDLGWHLYEKSPESPFPTGLYNLLETHDALRFPINLHLSGSLLAALSWLREDPESPYYPYRDGKYFLGRVKQGLDEGWATLVGGVFAEQIMPYFEGMPNLRSMKAYGQLVSEIFSLSPPDMPVMHIPERVMQSDSAWGKLRGLPYTGNPFPDILEAGYSATYLDEVTHLHHWFYPEEHLSEAWTDERHGRWAGAGGDDDEPYHHKVHRINGVLCFMINDREDSAKFYASIYNAPDKDSIRGIPKDIKWPLLSKLTSDDPAQLTLLFDDWEAFAGNCFDCPPQDNPVRWHRLVRWMQVRPWIKGQHLREVLSLAVGNPDHWIIDHGEVDGKRMLGYEWLQRATEHSYDNWYYGSILEESFARRHPVYSPSGKLHTRLPYGDLATTNSLIHQTWRLVEPESPDLPLTPAELSFFAMSYETAWHDEDMPLVSYKSRNYQETFDRVNLGSMEDYTFDRISGWALDLHGHLRKSAVYARADQWAKLAFSGTIGLSPGYSAEDVDLDGDKEYLIFNSKMLAVIERWGARVESVFVLSPEGRAVPVVGVGIARPSSEGEYQENSTGKIPAFQDRFAAGVDSMKYIDMPHQIKLSRSGIETRSADGKIQKHYTLDGYTIACRYKISRGTGPLHVRFGLSPDWPYLMSAGQEGMNSGWGEYPSWRVSSSSGAWVSVGWEKGALFAEGELPYAGYKNRGAPMTEQVEIALPELTGTIYLTASHD